MNRTREALGRNRFYIALVMACLIYGLIPLTPREAAMQRAEQATEEAMQWLVDHAPYIHRNTTGAEP